MFDVHLEGAGGNCRRLDMKKHELNYGCSGCGITRRQFLAGCTMCAGSAALGMSLPVLAAGNENKMRIRIVYSLHAAKQPGPDWPNVGFDFEPVMKRINTTLANRCRGLEFVSSMANGGCTRRTTYRMQPISTAGPKPWEKCSMRTH